MKIDGLDDCANNLKAYLNVECLFSSAIVKK